LRQGCGVAPHGPAGHQVRFGEGDALGLVEALVGKACVGGEDVFVADEAFMLEQVLESVPGPGHRRRAAELLVELAPQRRLAGLAELDRPAQRPDALHASAIVLHLGDQQLRAAPHEAQHLHLDLG
jgi:hypothetical protein